MSENLTDRYKRENQKALGEKSLKILVIAPFPSVIWNIAVLYAKVFREHGWEAELINSRQGKLRLNFFLNLLMTCKNFDVLNVHTAGYFDQISLVYSIIATKLWKARRKKPQKIIFTCHSGDLRNSLKKTGKFMKFFFNAVDNIIAISECMKKELASFGKSREYKIVVIQNFLDRTAKNEEFFREKEKIALTVATVSWDNVPRKGLDTFIKAARYIPDVKFVIVGKHADDSIHQLKSIASTNVIFTGYVSADERDNWFKRSLVYCQLSSSEGLCVSLLESMSFGCVPVVTNTTSNPEVVGECGFLVPYGDAMKTVEAVKTAILHPEKGKCALERFNSDFTLEARRKDLVNIIERVWKAKV